MVEVLREFGFDTPDLSENLLVNIISLRYLKVNKKATGRFKDLNDLENLP